MCVGFMLHFMFYCEPLNLFFIQFQAFVVKMNVKTFVSRSSLLRVNGVRLILRFLLDQITKAPRMLLLHMAERKDTSSSFDVFVSTNYQSVDPSAKWLSRSASILLNPSKSSLQSNAPTRMEKGHFLQRLCCDHPSVSIDPYSKKPLVLLLRPSTSS